MSRHSSVRQQRLSNDSLSRADRRTGSRGKYNGVVTAFPSWHRNVRRLWCLPPREEEDGDMKDMMIGVGGPDKVCFFPVHCALRPEEVQFRNSFRASSSPHSWPGSPSLPDLRARGAGSGGAHGDRAEIRPVPGCRRLRTGDAWPRRRDRGLHGGQ